MEPTIPPPQAKSEDGTSISYFAMQTSVMFASAQRAPGRTIYYLFQMIDLLRFIDPVFATAEESGKADFPVMAETTRRQFLQQEF